jgi:glycosyltransferase involved in cell wall biosynthesis
VEVIGIRPSAEPFAYNPDPAYLHTTLYRDPPAPAWHAKTLMERVAPSRIMRARAARRRRRDARTLLLDRLRRVGEGYLVTGSPWAADWIATLDWRHLRGIGQYHESFAQARASANLRLITTHYLGLDKALFLSEDDVEAFERMRLPNAGYMPNPLTFYPAEPARVERPVVISVGRLDPIKRLDRLIQAFAKASAGVEAGAPEWELHLVGEGPEEATLREMAAAHGIADRVVFRGRVADVESAYRQASVLALTSEREGWGLVLAEAAACGLPSVAFDVSGGVRRLVDDGRTGRLVTQGDVDGFAAALADLMADPALRRRYGAAAREHVRPLTLDSVLDRWEAVFDEIDR